MAAVLAETVKTYGTEKKFIRERWLGLTRAWADDVRYASLSLLRCAVQSSELCLHTRTLTQVHSAADPRKRVHSCHHVASDADPQSEGTGCERAEVYFRHQVRAH